MRKFQQQLPKVPGLLLNRFRIARCSPVDAKPAQKRTKNHSKHKFAISPKSFQKAFKKLSKFSGTARDLRFNHPDWRNFTEILKILQRYCKDIAKILHPRRQLQFYAQLICTPSAPGPATLLGSCCWNLRIVKIPAKVWSLQSFLRPSPAARKTEKLPQNVKSNAPESFCNPFRKIILR